MKYHNFKTTLRLVLCRWNQGWHWLLRGKLRGNMGKTKKVKVERTIYEDRYLSAIALNQLEQAKLEGEGHQFRWVVPSMAFSVFRVEALCNIYGGQLFPHWHHFESMSFIGKITMISEFLKIEVNFSSEPWQTINLMKNFRNTLVHAKPQKVSEIHEVPDHLPERLTPFPKEKKTIMSYSSIETAEKFNSVASKLEMLWFQGADVQGYKIDTVGAPEYETVK